MIHGMKLDPDQQYKWWGIKCGFHFTGAGQWLPAEYIENLIVHFVKSAYVCVHNDWRMYVGRWGGLHLET